MSRNAIWLYFAIAVAVAGFFSAKSWKAFPPTPRCPSPATARCASITARRYAAIRTTRCWVSRKTRSGVVSARAATGSLCREESRYRGVRLMSERAAEKRRVYQREWIRKKRESPEFREIVRLRMIERNAARNKDRAYLDSVNERKKRTRSNEKNRARERRSSAAYRARYPDKNAAKGSLCAAVRSGRIVRPTVCSACGETPQPGSDGRTQIHGHHPDYSKPLEVEWLCVTCHKKRH